MYGIGRGPATLGSRRDCVYQVRYVRAKSLAVWTGPITKSVGLGGEGCVGVSEDSGDMSGEACWDQLSSLYALKLVDIRKDGVLSR